MPSVDAAEMRVFVADVVSALGATDDAADVVADTLVGADLRGHYSHGVRLLPTKYADEVAAGEIDPAATPEVDREMGWLSRIDGRRAFGHVAAHLAVDVAVDRAGRTGCHVSTLCNVTHIGRVGHWAERAVAHDLAFVSFLGDPGAAWVAPPGSAERRLSTNPITIGVPTYGSLDFPLVLDVATSQVARGKISLRHADAEDLPEGWVVTETGESVTDPAAFEAGTGALLPLGGTTAGHKGFGLSVMSEVIAACLSDWFVSGQPDAPKGNVAAFFVFDPATATSDDAMADRLSAFAAYLRSSEYSPSVPTGRAAKGDHALLPGEAEHRRAEHHRDVGIEYPGHVLRAVRSLANELDLGDSMPDEA